MILYEYPFNERIRIYLRLEHLFKRLEALVARHDALDHHFALVTLFEVMDVASRADLKAEVLKDLERNKQAMAAYRSVSSIDHRVLENVIEQLDAHYATLSAQLGKAGQALSENDWLMSIRSRSAIPGGTCSFDAPAYFDWQHRDAQLRRSQMVQWAQAFLPLGKSISLLLRMLRDSGAPQMVSAPMGQFQQTLPTGKTFLLMRLNIDPQTGWIPEISGNRMMVSVRLMCQAADGKLAAAPADATFEMTLCS